VLLSPDGRNAANPDARCTSYVEFALAMAAELRDLPQGPLRSAFSMVLTHLITATVPGRIDWVRLAAEPDAWAGFPWRQAGVPRERFRELSDLFDVLTRRMR